MGIFLSAVLPVWGQPAQEPAATRLRVTPTSVNYYIATLVEESENYAPTFYDDYLVTLDSRAIAHFTRLANEVVDFYFYLSNPEEIAAAIDFLKTHRADCERISPKLLPALEKYAALRPSYDEKGLYEATGKVIMETSKTTMREILKGAVVNKINAALYRYLKSNAVERLSDIRKDKALTRMLVNKFYMLSTTSFYRGWLYIKAFKDHLGPVKTLAQKESRPFKAHVFACSTGEEAITYAIEFLEADIKNFTIIGSDINDSSLESARQFRYSSAALERLPFEAQAKIKKYFHLVAGQSFWEPIDKEFFRRHIKYINQNILEDLPAGLGPDFSPPYDFISILNVLLYLDADQIKNKKDYWARLLNTGGILVLHDKKYSLTSPPLGDCWAFKNFYSVNGWVNIKTAPDAPVQGKAAAYEKVSRDFSEAGLLLVSLAYTCTNQPGRQEKVYRDCLAKDPYSPVALVMLLDFYSRNANDVGQREIMNRLSQVYIFPDKLLDNFIAQETSSEEVRFLNELKRRFSAFLQKYRNQPRDMEKMFDSTILRSDKWEGLRRVFSLYTLSLLYEHYTALKQDADMERICLKLLNESGRLCRDYPQYLVTADFLGKTVADQAQNYINKGDHQKAYALCRRGINMLEHSALDHNFTLFQGALAAMYLLKADAMAKQNDFSAEFKDALDKASSRLALAIERVNEAVLYNSAKIYLDAGNAYWLRAGYWLKNSDKEKAALDLNQALRYFETGLQIDPVYGRDLDQARRDLLRLAKDNDLAVALSGGQ